MAKKFRTARELLYWEYAKLICQSRFGAKDQYAFIQGTVNRLRAGKIFPSSILRENQKLIGEPKACAYCHATKQLQWEHIIPKSTGGPDTIDNMVLACGDCNRKKGARDPYQWYGPGRSKDIPRLVLGKLLKVLLTEYERLGLLDDESYFAKEKIERANLCRIFKSKISNVEK